MRKVRPIIVQRLNVINITSYALYSGQLSAFMNFNRMVEFKYIYINVKKNKTQQKTGSIMK